MLLMLQSATPISRPRATSLDFIAAPVSPAFVEANRPAILELLQTAHNRHAPDGFNPYLVIDRALDQMSEIWLIMIRGKVRGVMVTSVEDWPMTDEFEGGLVVQVEALGGKGVLKYIRRIVESVKVYARMKDAVLVVASGRPGWSKILGLRPVAHILHLEILR